MPFTSLSLGSKKTRKLTHSQVKLLFSLSLGFIFRGRRIEIDKERERKSVCVCNGSGTQLKGTRIYNTYILHIKFLLRLMNMSSSRIQNNIHQHISVCIQILSPKGLSPKIRTHDAHVSDIQRQDNNISRVPQSLHNKHQREIEL